MRYICRNATLGTVLAGVVLAANPTQITTAKGPNGVAATEFQLLFTQPYCNIDAGGATPVQRGVYSVDTTTGAASLYAALPVPTTMTNGLFCAEAYIALAQIGNAGGFTPGAAYVTQGPVIFVVPPGGGLASAMNITGAPLTSSHGHSGIQFDTVGSFGSNLIYTSEDGVWTVTAGGFATKIANGIAPTTYIESPSVSANGTLFVTAEDVSAPHADGPLGGLYALVGGALTRVPSFCQGCSPGAPESINFIPANPCSLTVAGTTFGAFLAVYTQSTPDVLTPTDGAIVGFSIGDIAANAGSGIETFEYSQDSGYFNSPDLKLFNAATNAYSTFANMDNELEGFNLVTCRVPQPPSAPGRMTGGGSVFESDGTRVTHGMELHCDVADLPNNLEINWAGNRFHLQNLTSAFCYKDPLINAQHPTNIFNTYVGSGTGDYNGVAGATASFTFTDAGEPGRNDHATITIKDVLGNTVLTVSGFLNNGNQQAHVDNK
jgi:hypothetical protein